MKIGLLVGRETDFPEALIEHINGKGRGVTCEMVELAGTALNDTIPYSVIIDRISHEIPYYRLFLTKAVADGVTVINNPFWWSADNKFFECILAERLGVAVPRTVLLPNRAYEADIIDQSLRNLAPIPWDDHVRYTGLPAVLKPAIGGGSKTVTIVRTVDELIAAYEESGITQLIMQEFIDYQDYVRCFVIGREDVCISSFDFRAPRYDRYTSPEHLSPALRERVEDECLRLNRALGYDINTVELAIRDGVTYAIDFLNPAPDSERRSINSENFEWVVEHVANLAIQYATGERQPEVGMTWQAMMTAPPESAGARAGR